jgi:Mrp family chromosome partitioning ATPase
MNKMKRKASLSDYSSLADMVLVRKHTKGQQVFLVASSGQSEGKTTTSINLAKALALNGCRTILVDLDFVRPEISKVLKLPEPVTNGFEAPQPVQYNENLWILSPAGGSAALKKLFLGSDKGKEFILDLKKEFDVLILDSSSQNSAYVEYLDKLCDGVIIVAKAYHTAPEEVVNFARRFTQAEPAGVVLNRRKEYVPRILRKFFIGS